MGGGGTGLCVKVSHYTSSRSVSPFIFKKVDPTEYITSEMLEPSEGQCPLGASSLFLFPKNHPLFLI